MCSFKQGTTSVRTLESVYWQGARILLGGSSNLTETGDCFVGQWQPYEALDEVGCADCLPPVEEALEAAAEAAETAGFSDVSGVTRLLIIPGYPFQTYAFSSHACACL